MNLEIERKFLVKNEDFKNDSFKKIYIKQGYLNTDKNRTVRIRITNEKAFITIKGKSNETGTSRFEWEKEISKEEASSLLLLSETTVIEKNRYFVKNERFTFEVDEFLGDNKGLLLAEIELNSENEDFKRAAWLGEEVTGNVKYYNSYLSKNPFKNWT